jgi:hypothetical protein
MKYKYKDFEDYLQTAHDAQFVGTGDDAPDDYEDWMSNLSADDWITYADKYGELCKKI